MKFSFLKSFVTYRPTGDNIVFTKDEIKALVKGIKSESLEERYAQKLKDETIEILLKIGKPIISVTNEWENPTIGIVIGVDYMTKAKVPVAKIYDFLRNEVTFCTNRLIPCTDSNLEAILLLNPYQCWNLINRTSISASKPRYNNDILSPETIKQVLKSRSFEQVLHSLEMYSSSNLVFATTDLINNDEFVKSVEQKIKKILLSFNLNIKE